MLCEHAVPDAPDRQARRKVRKILDETFRRRVNQMIDTGKNSGGAGQDISGNRRNKRQRFYRLGPNLFRFGPARRSLDFQLQQARGSRR